MSSISSINGNSSAWSLYQQQALQPQTTDSTSSTDSTTSTDASTATNSTTQTASTTATGSTQGAPRMHGHHHGGHGGGEQKFDSALEDQGITGTKLTDLRSQIQSAVQDARSNGNDPKDAVDTVLKNAGVDTDKLKQEMGAPTLRNGSSTTAAGDSTDSNSSSIESLLQGSGIDPSQFKSSLQQLLSDPNSTSNDFGSLFSSAQLGSTVDVAA